MCQGILECELLVGTRSAEGVIGQRSCGPHQKAEHMAAPTNAAKREKALANSEPSTHGTDRVVSYFDGRFRQPLPRGGFRKRRSPRRKRGLQKPNLTGPLLSFVCLRKLVVLIYIVLFMSEHFRRGI